MNTPIPPTPTHPPLEQILLRKDIWRGYTQSDTYSAVIASGSPALDAALLNGGLPLQGLIEVCQQGFTQQELFLLSPSLKRMEGLIVLLNPPFTPFVQGLVFEGIDLERLRIVHTDAKAEFLSSFVELTRTSACCAILAWEPSHKLTYTELRKCLLSSNQGSGLYTLFRTAAMQQQSSPASLRMLVSLSLRGLSVTIFKQRGALQSDTTVTLSLPAHFDESLPFHLLDHDAVEKTVLRPKPTAPVIPLRRKQT